MRNLWLVSVLVLMISGVCADEKLTLKGMYVPSNVLNANVSHSDRGVKTKINTDYNLNGGFGFGAEYPVMYTIGIAKPRVFEVLGGFNYIPARSVSSYTDRAKINSVSVRSQKTDLEKSELKIQTTSFYLKPRYFFDLKPLPAARIYVGGKLSYNLNRTSGSMKNELKLGNGFGYGFSLGSVINNDWDVELAWERIGSEAKDDRYAETLKGQYQLSSILLSLGYRI